MGKKRLERAIEQHRKTAPGGAEDTFSISWHPFYLDPTAPRAGQPLRERLAQRFGPAMLPAMEERLTAVGREEGIDFRFGSTTGNTVRNLSALCFSSPALFHGRVHSSSTKRFPDQL